MHGLLIRPQMYCFYFDKQNINQEKWINIDKKIDICL